MTYVLIAFVFCILFIMLMLVMMLKDDSGEWLDYPENRPSHDKVTAHPVALYDEEFGVVIDMADYRPNRIPEWVLTGSGDEVRPYKWYRLTPPPPYISKK